MINNAINAIIWDYDGTLVDTRSKNYNVTKEIVKKVTGKKPESYAVLRTLENYVQANKETNNWRILYQQN